MAGLLGLLILVSLPSVWDTWTINMASRLANRALGHQSSTPTVAGSGTQGAPAMQGTPAAQGGPAETAAQAIQASLATQAMQMMEHLAARGPHTAAREIPIWRTYGAAAILAPSDHAFELLVRSRDAGRLDRIGELWLGEVASATGHWDVAREAYRRIDASNVLLSRAEASLQAGNKAVAVQQFRLARESLEAAIERDRAR
ncbi:MAG: hypothetical protein H5T84_09890, partial [Thermoleophilia bacterium]|nr:hypothetical protein [Thermoleophilia bacterium]